MIDKKTSASFRGLAILMVVVSHYAGWLFGNPAYPDLKSFVMGWGVYGVDIFMLLSGYGLVKSSQKQGITGRFVLRRVFNVALPYYLIVGIFKIIDKAFTGPEDVKTYLLGTDYWFINVILTLYIIFMVCYRIGWHKEVLFTVAFTVYCIVMWYRGAQDFWLLSNPAFLIGVYGASLEKRFGDRVETIIKKINLPAIGLAGTFVFSYVFYCIPYKMWPEMVRSIFFTVFVLGVCVEFCGGGAVLPALGRFSLYMYILHGRVFARIVEWDLTWGSDMNLTIGSIVITCVVSIALGYAVEWNLNRLLLLTDKLDKHDKLRSEL